MADDLAAARVSGLQQLDQRVGGPIRIGDRPRPLARERLCPQPGRHRPGIEQVDVHPGQPQLGGVGQDQGLEAALVAAYPPQ